MSRCTSGQDGPTGRPSCWNKRGPSMPEAMLAADRPHAFDPLQTMFFYSRAETIYGGSNEIQRNIVGERALGLPREP